MFHDRLDDDIVQDIREGIFFRALKKKATANHFKNE